MWNRTRGGPYVDGPEAGAVAGGHILVESLDGVGAGHLTVLLVHVVSAGPGVVADPDAKVLDLLGALLGDLWGALVAAEFSMSGAGVRTWFSETISPLAFLILRSLPRKYQKRDFATTSLGAKMRIR